MIKTKALEEHRTNQTKQPTTHIKILNFTINYFMNRTMFETTSTT